MVEQGDDRWLTTPPWLAVRCLAGRFRLSSPAWRPPAVRRNTPTTVRSPLPLPRRVTAISTPSSVFTR